MKITANTRTSVKWNHALISPDGFVNSVLPGWSDCEINVIINDRMGAQFSQHLIHMTETGLGEGETQESELFFYVIEGQCEVTVSGATKKMSSGGFVFIPPTSGYQVKSSGDDTQLLSFQKVYEPLERHAVPDVVWGNRSQIPSELYLDDTQLHMTFS